MLPDRRLLDNDSTSNAAKSPRTEGISHERMLLDRLRTFKSNRLASQVGILPVRGFEDSDNTSRAVKLPKELVISPNNKLLSNASVFS